MSIVEDLPNAALKGTSPFEKLGDGSYVLDPVSALQRRIEALTPIWSLRKHHE